MPILLAPTANFIQTTLNGAITSGAASITLNSVANLPSAGYIVVDRTDSNGNSTPSNREVITYTGITGSQLTGATRGADNSIARSHSDGAIVETMPTVGLWNSLATAVSVGLDVNGLLQAIASPVSITNLISGTMFASIASIAIADIGTQLNASGASITGFGINPVWRTSGSYSGPTTFVGGILVAPQAGTIRWISAITRYVASGTSVAIDIQKNGTSIFANATTRPAITAGGTYVSIASIATMNVNRSDILTASIDSMLAGAGLITDLTIQGGAY